MTDSRMPAVFLSHGAPPLADDAVWTRELGTWGRDLPTPEAILVVSAHWEQAPPALSPSRQKVGLTYDFWGFPQKYYEVTYDAPLAPELADRVADLVPLVTRDETRGLDHGAYVPLVEMYPDADVPVLQLSMPTLEPQALFDLGARLAPLRDEGVLVMGSGFTTHNLRWFKPGQQLPGDPPPAVSAEFDHWAAEAVARGDVDALIDMQGRAPAPHEAHPRTEHWAPLYVALGAALGEGGQLDSRVAVDGFWFGLSKRSWQFA